MPRCRVELFVIKGREIQNLLSSPCPSLQFILHPKGLSIKQTNKQTMFTEKAYWLERVSRLQHKEGNPRRSPSVSLVEETELEAKEAVVWRRESCTRRKLQRSAESLP